MLVSSGKEAEGAPAAMPPARRAEGIVMRRVSSPALLPQQGQLYAGGRGPLGTLPRALAAGPALRKEPVLLAGARHGRPQASCCPGTRDEK